MTTIKEYLPSGAIVYSDKQHIVIWACGRPQELFEYIIRHNLKVKKNTWLSYDYGHWTIESRERFTCDSRAYKGDVRNMIKEIIKAKGERQI